MSKLTTRDTELREKLNFLLKLNWPEIAQSTKAGVPAEITIDKLLALFHTELAAYTTALKAAMPEKKEPAPGQRIDWDERGMDLGFNEARDQTLQAIDRVYEEWV